MTTEATPPVETRFFTYGGPDDPVQLRSGATLPGVTLAYETHGRLNPGRDNAILVFHALTGSHHAAGWSPSVPGIERWTDECRLGWWDGFIGPGKALDTTKWFVICVNYLGGCYGSTGPSSIDPRTGRPFGGTFPPVSFADMVDGQVELVRSLGIERLRAVVGGSTGAFMCLSLATRYPDLVDIVVPIAGGVRVTALQKIHNFEQITAIENDPDFAGGEYPLERPPRTGLMLARMIGHKTFVSLAAMEDRARAEIVRPDEGPGTYRIKNTLESYMWHQGAKFVERFDANSYVRIMEAWQTFDLAGDAGSDHVGDVFTPCKHQRYMVFSIDSDVCFYPEEQAELVHFLKLADVPTRWITVHSDKGHDSFLLEPALYAPHLVDTLENGI